MKHDYTPQIVFSQQKAALKEIQQRYYFKHRPKPAEIYRLVKKLCQPFIDAKQKPERVRYFRLIATSALFNQEAMYRNWSHKKVRQ